MIHDPLPYIQGTHQVPLNEAEALLAVALNRTQLAVCPAGCTVRWLTLAVSWRYNGAGRSQGGVAGDDEEKRRQGEQALYVSDS